MFYIDKNGFIYQGEMVSGDRVATSKEVLAWEESRKPSYKQLRAPEYPPLSDFADAYYWDIRGNGKLMDAYLAKCDEVKERIPKNGT